jgi:hypothetical protein
MGNFHPPAAAPQQMFPVVAPPMSKISYIDQTEFHGTKVSRRRVASVCSKSNKSCSLNIENVFTR